jgi:dGTPase
MNDDFVRTRLTHSLEVAQIGGEIAGNFGLNINLQETVCLAHDVGHPPFGHNGEKTLNEICDDIGGFEGNAQTFRVLTRLAYKKFIKNGRSIGLNLTRGVLNGVVKYPWTLHESSNGKFSVYLLDINYFKWVRKYSKKNIPTIYAQIMDFADDVAYSVNDVEDTIITTNYNLNEFIKNESEIIDIANNYFAINSTFSELKQAIKRLTNLSFWANRVDLSSKGVAIVKNLTSELIERFVKSVILSESDVTSTPSSVKYLHIPKKILNEIAVLKAFSHIFFINTKRQIKIKGEQKKLIQQIYKKYSLKPSLMKNDFYDEYKKAKGNKILQKRIIVDQIASLTDESIKKIL